VPNIELHGDELPGRRVNLYHHYQLNYTPEGVQNAGSAREPSVVALSSLVTPLRGAIHSFTCTRVPDRAGLCN
jgi:hypothetical protein